MQNPTQTAPQLEADKPLEIVGIGPNGEQKRRPYTQADLEWVASVKAREMFNAEVEKRLGESASGAAAWLTRYRAAHRDFVLPIDLRSVDGEATESHFVRCLSDSDIVEMGVLMARRGFSLFGVEDLEAQHAFNISLLCVGVCDESGERFFHGAEEAGLFYETPGAAELSEMLRTAIFSINPALSVKKKTMAKAMADPIIVDG